MPLLAGTKSESVVKSKSLKETDPAACALAAIIRQSSEAGRLISESDILRRSEDEHVFPSSDGRRAEEVLRKLVLEGEDLHELAAENGSRFYYSSRFMTSDYAGILLYKEGDPLRLIAEIVRDNSKIYPRPVPLDLFIQPPFELSRQEMAAHLDRMAKEEGYGDIAAVTTSQSSVFLFSTLHLDPDYASMLAEWLDVGQSNNP